jgi:hypothetical protein
MPNHKVKCSQCNRDFWLEAKHYYNNLSKFKVENLQQLSQVYLCQGCRSSITKLYQCVSQTDVYKDTTKKLFTFLKENPNTSRNNLEETIKVILDKAGVRMYRLDMIDNVLKGIIIKMPFFMEVYIKLNTKRKQY